MKVWSQHQINCLNVMGVTRWQSKNQSECEKSTKTVDPLPTPPPIETQTLVENNVLTAGNVQEDTLNSVTLSSTNNSQNINGSANNWQDLQSNAINCQACSRCNNRQQAIVGEGNTSSNIVIITEAPLLKDDEAGRVFTGATGELFNKMLGAINITPSSVYITPVVKCFQANSQSVQQDEFEQCLTHLQAQINLIKPSLIIIFGENAAQMILKNQSPLTALRQQVHLSLNQIKTIVTYSPETILSDVSKKRDIWEDLKFTQKTLLEHGINA